MIYDLAEAPARFASKVRVNQNDCWIWRGSLNRAGYARFRLGGRNASASRENTQAYRRRAA